MSNMQTKISRVGRGRHYGKHEKLRGNECRQWKSTRLIIENYFYSHAFLFFLLKISPAPKRWPQSSSRGSGHRHADLLQEQRPGSVDTRRRHCYTELRVRLLIVIQLVLAWQSARALPANWGPGKEGFHHNRNYDENLESRIAAIKPQSSLCSCFISDSKRNIG